MEGPSKWAKGPSLYIMYVKLTKIRGRLQGQGAIKENGGTDELLFWVIDQNQLHIWIDCFGDPSSTLHSFLIT